MIDSEVWYDMISMHRNGMSISAIARCTGRNRRTVRKYIRRGASPPEPKARAKRSSKLDPYKDHIKQRIEEYDLSAVRLLEEIRPMGYAGCYTLVKNYARAVRRTRGIQAVLRYETAPGMQAQVDWGNAGPVEIDGGAGRAYAFAMVLGFSRAKYVEYTLDCRTETFIRCHLNAFAHFGGYTKELLYDNTKNVVLRRALKSSESEWNPLFKDFLHHHGITPRLCRPYRAATKGKIERVIRFEQDNFLKGRQFASLQELNSQALAWIKKVDSRPHGTTGIPPLQRLEEERSKLMLLSDKPPYQIVQEEHRKVSRDCFVSYLGTKYSVPWRFAGREARLLIQDGKMKVEVGGELACEHELRASSGGVVRVREHFAGLYKEVRASNLLVHEKAMTMQSRLRVVPLVEQRPLDVYDQFLGGK